MAELFVRRDGPVGRIIFSNPDKFNAMTQDMWSALPGELRELDEDAAIRVIVLQGDGTRAFVSGADISQFKDQRTDPVAQKRYNQIVEAASRSWLQRGGHQAVHGSDRRTEHSRYLLFSTRFRRL